MTDDPDSEGSLIAKLLHARGTRERVRLIWYLFLDGLLVIAAIAVRAATLYVLGEFAPPGTMDWALIALQWIVDLGFVLAVALIVVTDLYRQVRWVMRHPENGGR